MSPPDLTERTGLRSEALQKGGPAHGVQDETVQAREEGAREEEEIVAAVPL
jgi:hypothetical protein